MPGCRGLQAVVDPMDKFGQGSPQQQPALTPVVGQAASQGLGHPRFVGHDAQEIELRGLGHLRWRIWPVAYANQRGGNFMGNQSSGLMNQRNKMVEPGSSDEHEQVTVLDELSRWGTRPHSANVDHSIDVVETAKAFGQSPRYRAEYESGGFPATRSNQDG